MIELISAIRTTHLVALTSAICAAIACGGKIGAVDDGAGASGSGVVGGNGSVGGAVDVGGYVSVRGSGGVATGYGGNVSATVGGSPMQATGGSPVLAIGGAPITGGSKSTGGMVATGGAKSTTSATGGAVNASVGGATTGGGSAVAISTANCATPTPASGSFTRSSSYFKVGNYVGYGYVQIGANATNNLTCPESSFGSSTTALCGAGTVPADSSYVAYGLIGFSLNQSAPITSPATVSQVVVTFVNTAGSDVHIQITQLLGTTQTTYCYEAKSATSPLTLKASDFNTTCWTTGGTPWNGTGAEEFQVEIPSQPAFATPFDVCIVNVVIT